MKKAIVFAMLVAILASIGCATAKKAEPAPKAAPVVLGADGIPMPDWVFKSVKSQDYHYESGYGKMSDRQTSIKRATVEAKNKIAEWISTSVKEVITTYLSDSGSGDTRQNLDAMEVISVQIAEATLSGVTTDELWFDADGGVWVLCSIPMDVVEKSFEATLMKNAEKFTLNEAADVANAKMQEALARLNL